MTARNLLTDTIFYRRRGIDMDKLNANPCLCGATPELFIGINGAGYAVVYHGDNSHYVETTGATVDEALQKWNNLLPMSTTKNLTSAEVICTQDDRM